MGVRSERASFDTAIYACLHVFFIAQAEISLLGEVNLVRDLVDNKRSCGVTIAGFDLSI